jgi:DNA repair exonuclease SbcCD ATPase subunit
LSESLVKTLAQKYGLSEEDVKLALEMIGGGEDELGKTISTVATTGEALAKTPKDVQQAIAPLVAATVLKQLSADPFQQKMLSLTGSLLTIKTLLGEDKGVERLVQSITDQIRALNERLAKLEETKKSEEIQAIAQSIENLRADLEELRSRMESGPTAVTQQVASTANPLAQASSQLDEFTRTLNAVVDGLKALGFEVKKPGEVKPIDDIDKAKEILVKYGYEVKPRYMSEEEFQRRLQEERRRYEKLLEKRLRKSEKIAEAKARQVEAIVALGLEVVKYLRSLAQPAGQAGGGVVEVARRRVVQGVQQAQQSPT